MIRYTEERIQELLRKGALMSLGTDEDGDEMYLITQKCKDIDPDLFQYRMDFVGLASMRLWQLEFVEIFLDGETLKVKLTEKAFDQSAMMRELTPDLRHALKQLRVMLKENNDIENAGRQGYTN